MQNIGGHSPHLHDPEELLVILGSFQSQVQDLYNQTAALVDKMRTRHEHVTTSNIMLDELEARINEMILTSGALDQRWNDMLDLNQVANILDEMECLFDELEEQLHRSRESFDSPEIWLFGTRFSTADISATTLILRLYLLGLDDRFFNEKRPLLCEYRSRLLERPGARRVKAMFGSMAQTVRRYLADNFCMCICEFGALAAIAGVGFFLYKKL